MVSGRRWGWGCMVLLIAVTHQVYHCQAIGLNRPVPQIGVSYTVGDLFSTVTKKRQNHFFVLLGPHNRPLTDNDLRENPELVNVSTPVRAWGSRVGLLKPSECWDNKMQVVLHEDKALMRHLVQQKRLPNPAVVPSALKRDAHQLISNYKRLASYFVLKVNGYGKLDPVHGIAYRFYIGNPKPKPYVIGRTYRRGKGRIPILRGQAMQEARLWNFKQSLLGAVTEA